jgi:hypothetical protein
MRWPSTAVPAGARGHAQARAEPREQRNACGAGKTARAPRGLEYPASPDCCYSYQTTSPARCAGRVSGGPPPTWPAKWLAGKAFGPRAGQPGRASGPIPKRTRTAASPASCVAGEDSFSPGGMALVGSACTGAGPFFLGGGGSAATRRAEGPAGWSQRTCLGTGPWRGTRPKEVTSAPNPVSTTGSAYPKCGLSGLTASRSGSLH